MPSSVNDRPGLLYWSGSFQSQRSTKSRSSTSQSSRGAVRTQECAHVLANTPMCSSCTRVLRRFPCWLMVMGWNTNKADFCLQCLFSSSASNTHSDATFAQTSASWLSSWCFSRVLHSFPRGLSTHSANKKLNFWLWLSHLLHCIINRQQQTCVQCFSFKTGGGPGGFVWYLF